MIVGLIWILISLPIWLGLTFFYMMAMGLFYLAIFGLEIVISIINLFNKGHSLTDTFTSIIGNLFISLSKWLPRYDDVFNFFWEFGRYDYPGWAIVCSIILFIFYVVSSR